MRTFEFQAAAQRRFRKRRGLEANRNAACSQERGNDQVPTMIVVVERKEFWFIGYFLYSTSTQTHFMYHGLHCPSTSRSSPGTGNPCSIFMPMLNAAQRAQRKSAKEQPRPTRRHNQACWEDAQGGAWQHKARR